MDGVAIGDGGGEVGVGMKTNTLKHTGIEADIQGVQELPAFTEAFPGFRGATLARAKDIRALVPRGADL